VPHCLGMSCCEMHCQPSRTHCTHPASYICTNHLLVPQGLVVGCPPIQGGLLYQRQLDGVFLQFGVCCGVLPPSVPPPGCFGPACCLFLFLGMHSHMTLVAGTELAIRSAKIVLQPYLRVVWARSLRNLFVQPPAGASLLLIRVPVCL
jgi:hypothetical protein